MKTISINLARVLFVLLACLLYSTFTTAQCTIPVNFNCQFNIDNEGWNNDADCAIDLCVGQRLGMRVRQNSANYTYQWTTSSGEILTDSRILLLPGIFAENTDTYTILITDNVTGCTAEVTFDVNVLDATIVSTIPSCPGSNDGTITVNPINSSGAVSYSIDGVNFQSSNTFTNLPQGSYDIYIMDANITEPCFINAVDLTSITSKAFAISPSCSDGIPNDNGFLQISLTNGDRFDFVEGSTYTGSGDYATATPISSIPVTSPSTLPNPTVPTDYTIRIYNGSGTCFQDVVVTMMPQNCDNACNCEEYLYLNETTNGGRVHKYDINENFDPSNPSLESLESEIGMPWYDNLVLRGDLTFPHGLGIDEFGNLYIGEAGSINAPNNDIRRLNCEAELVPESEFVIPDATGTNFGSLDGKLYVNHNDQNNPATLSYVTVYDLCDGSLLGFFCLDGLGPSDWGLSLNDDGTIYVSSDRDNATTNHIFVFDVNTETLNPPNDPNPVCIDPFLTADGSSPTIGSTNLTSNFIWGVTYDPDGNIYVVEEIRSGPDLPAGASRAYRIFKYDSNGVLVTTSVFDTVNGDGGFYTAYGIIYSEELDMLLVSTGSPVDDCVSLFDLDLNYLGPAVPATGTNDTQAKGFNLTKECCPSSNNIVIDTIICDAGALDELFLSDLFTCDGSICEGDWIEGTSNTGLTYDPCDESISIDSPDACGSFMLESDGVSDNSICGAFRIQINITLAENLNPMISGDQLLCPTDSPTELTSTLGPNSTSSVDYQWQMSTTNCNDGFTDIAGATSSTYTPSPITATTYYRLVTSTSSCPESICEEPSNCVTLTLDTNCCPEENCLTFSITRN